MQEYTIHYHLSKQGKTMTMNFRFSDRQLTVLQRFCNICVRHNMSHGQNQQVAIMAEQDKRFLQNLAYSIAEELYPVSAGYKQSDWGKQYVKTQPWDTCEGLQKKCLLATGHFIPDIDFEFKSLQEVTVTPARSPTNMFARRNSSQQNSKPLTGSQRRALKRQRQLRQEEEEEHSNIPRKC